MYTIKQAAQVTGMPASTLRAWEKRYGIGASGRTEAGYRLYDENSLAQLRRMGELVGNGWPPSRAAREVVSPDHETPTSGRTSDPRVDRMLTAAAELDAVSVREILETQFSSGRFETVIDTWLMPMLTSLGHAWRAGEIDVAGEHLVANHVRTKLSTLLEVSRGQAWAGRSSSDTVVLGLLPGSRHELGLLAFAVAIQRLGLNVCYLGADVPNTAWQVACQRISPQAAVTTVSNVAELARLRSLLRMRDELQVSLFGVGGALQDRAPEPCVALGHQIGPAASSLQRLLSG